jgi:hypothetical protein
VPARAAASVPRCGSDAPAAISKGQGQCPSGQSGSYCVRYGAETNVIRPNPQARTSVRQP